MQITHEKSGRFYITFFVATSHFPTLALTRSGSEGSELMLQSQPVNTGTPSAI